jgi:hypothetical protein
MKKIIAILLATCIMGYLPVMVTGCKSSQQKIAYDTIFTIEKVTVGAYDGYIAQVISGKVPTTGVQQISSKFNKFQAATLVALDAVQYNTNALAPASLVVESQDIRNLIGLFTKK